MNMFFTVFAAALMMAPVAEGAVPVVSPVTEVVVSPVLSPVAEAVGAKLSVPRVDLGATPKIGRVDAFFESSGLPLHEIGCVNWPERAPDKPEVSFRIAHSGDEIYIKYYVREEASRATFDADDGRPWQDSCVEFFVTPGEEGDPVYYNLEMACNGYGILHGGPLEPDGRAGASRGRVPDGISKVRRLPSMSREAFGIREGGQEWTMTLAIPVEVFSLSPVPPLSGRTLRANFYKCGDNLPRPHWVSWSPITGARTFHSPAFFGEVYFE
ncbi:MAG: hypothetical protein LBV38_06885 [Alistipes sp.]|jgi:hypothetical protein|nr:hypothetical protein [Alistipes sp.]